MPYIHPFCTSLRAVIALARLQACQDSSEISLKEYAICMPILCMCESSEGSDKTAHMHRRVWELTDRICHMFAHFVHVREQWRLWQDCMHATSSLSIGWKNMPYVRPLMCMCERSEGSGELRCVWAFTDKICHMYAHNVHVREQWKLWRDCAHAKASLSLEC